MSDRNSDITDLSELPPSTTTISTVAVQSGRSKVILAILRGAEWIRVRVHQMEPDLTDVGSTLEEALQLRQEHNEMLAKLKSKEDEIKNILASADAYAVENRSQADVYAAMAETLNEAWRELNIKLDHRSMLLDQSIAFHQSAQDFASKMEQAQGKFTSMLPTQDVNSARHLLQQHQDIKKSILESSQSTLQQGHSLLERIREMGMHADLQNRHATTAACYGIEHLLELLQDRRRRLEEIWEQRRFRLEQCLQLCQLDQETNKVLDWYRTTGSAYLHRTDLGDSHHHSQLIQEEHYRFETQARHVQENVLRLVRKADQLLRRTNLDAEGVRQRLQTVDHECENFMVRLDTKRKNISMALSFFDLVEKALTTLDQIEVQLNTMDLPRNSAELADRHAQLSNVIVEASTPALREGRILLERVSRDDPGADGVRRKMTQLQDRCSGLESLCKARRAEAWERSQTYLIFQEKYTEVHTWLTKICQATLAKHNTMGTSLTNAEDFLEVHEQLEQDIRDKNADVESLSEAGVNLVKSGDQESQSAAEKVDTLCKQIQRLHRIVEIRIQISIVYVTFHKLVQQLTNNMNGLEHIIKSETENLQDLTEDAVRHTEEMWTKVTETYNQLQDRGQDFLQSSSTIQDDSTIDIRSSANTVELITSEYTERMTMLSTTYESWTTHVNSSRQFKTQWHQFVQDARKTIDWVMKIEREFFYPNLAGYLGNTTQNVQEMQKKVDLFTPLYKRAQEEIERHLSTAELLSLKGNTKGQKDQIINELIKVRQRFTARIHEYQILLKMTIQFFRNLDQLDRLIEKTEKEYMESDLPSELSQAESLLEEHKRKKQEVSSLINYTADEGEKIVVRVRQTDAEAAAQDDVERVLKVTAEYKQRWNQAWEEQEKRLKQNLQICQFNYDLRQIHSEIDELHQHLQARRGSYGNSLPAARMNSQAFKQFEMTVELIEKKIQNFTSTADLMVQERHDDAVHIDRELDLLKTKWTTFHTSVSNYRQLLECSVEYFNLYEESETWIKEGHRLLMEIQRLIKEFRSSRDAEHLISTLNKFIENGRPMQESRLQRMSELVIELYGEEGPSRLHNLFVQNQEMMQSFQQAENHISQVKAQLKDRETGQPVVEEIQPMEVTVTASMPKATPPKIIMPLKDAEVMEGEKVTLECHVDSATQPEVMWCKDNLPLNSPDYETQYNRGVATLTIEETFSEDTARYTVHVTNEAGTTESSAYLHVRETHQQILPPDFTKNLKSVDVLENSPLSMECHVTGIPSPTISWYRDDLSIDSSPEFIITKINGTCCLKIRQAARHHSARYTCRANNPGGEAASSARITVVPMEKPIIHKMSEDVSIPEGKGVRLEIHFTGSPTPDVTWFRGQNRIIPSAVYKITIDINRCTLEIKEAYPEDSGTYTVVLQNAAGEIRRSCHVTVESFYSSTAESASLASTEIEAAKPDFIQHLSPAKEAMEGSRVRLDCILVGHPEPEVIWYKNDKPIKESKDIQLLFEGDRCTLCIREAYLEDSGTYRIIANNIHGQAESLCKLHVEPLSELSDASIGEMSSPRFSQPLRDFSVQSGHRVCLQCRITGHPIPEAKWYKDNKPIDNSPDFEITAFADVHNLTIPEAFEEDSGTYMVRAMNLAGEAKCYCKLTVKSVSEPMEQEEVMRMKRVVETKETNVNVRREDVEHSPPEFQRLFQDLSVNAGDSVTLECSITGAPKPKVTWFFNGQPVVSRDYQITMEGNIHRLYIPEVFDEDAGRFSITAENPSGKATCSAVLNVDEEPAPRTRIFGSTEYTSRRVSHTETVMSTETRMSRTIMTAQKEQRAYIPSTEQHATTIITDVKPQYEVPQLTAQEHFATTITADLQPKYQPVDLTIAVPVPPKFVQMLKNIQAMEGSKVTFEGVVTGKPEPTIKWFRENRELTDQADFEISYKDGRVSLTIPEVFQEDAGQFTCTAKNLAGSATSSAELIIRASVIPPSFTQKLQSQDVGEGAPVRFTIRVAGQPAPQVTWYKDGTKLTSSRDFEIVQDGDIHSLYIPEVFYEDAGKFSVTAQNPAGKTQCQAELRIQAPMEEVISPVQKPKVQMPYGEPTASPKLQRPSEFMKKDISPKTRAPAGPQKFTEQMEMEVAGDKKLPMFEQRFKLFQKPEETAPPRQVSEVSYKPAITPKQPPKFTKRLQDKTIKEGERLILEVHVEYKGPEPIVKWYREGLIIRNSPDYQITLENGRSQLSVAEVFPEDTGVYKCVAANADGSDSTEAMLRVIAPSPSQYEKMPIDERPDVATHVPMEEERVPSPVEPHQPIFLETPQDFRLVEGTNAIFECSISGKPFPEITWRKRGFPIRNDARHRISIDEYNGRCSLVISNCKADDAGDYTCTAINFAGETNSTATLLPAEVKPPPPPPAPELPKTQPPSWQQKPWQQRTEPPAKKPWQQKETQPSWAAVTDQFTHGEVPHRSDKGFVTTRSERILESNLEYRRSQEPEERPVTSAADFQPAGFEDRLRQQNYIKDGRIKFSSETETSQSEYESEIDRSPVAQPSPPQITQRLKDFRLMEGSDATFVCRISGRPRPKVAWYLNGHRIKRSNRYEMKFTKDGYCTLRIRMALPEDAGHYTILAVNNLGKDTCSSKLYVDRLGNIDATSFVAPETLDKILNQDKKETEPEDESGILEALSRPVFKKAPEDREVHEGNTVRMDTLVTGRPVPELSWFLNGQPVHNDDHHKIVVNEDGVNSLIILGASRYDTGTYKCVAKNKAGENSFTVKLKVMEKEQMQPPKFVERMQNFTVNEGQPMTLTCQLTGVPVPMISWQKDGKMLTPSSPYQIHTEGGRSSLTIPAVHISDAAWFQCSATNIAGTATTRAKLNVQAQPKKVEPPKKKISITKAPKKVPSPPTVPQMEPHVSRTNSPPHYEIQPEGLVQQISYSTERESGILRFVKEEDISRLGQRPIDQATSRKTMTPQVPAVQPLVGPTEEQPMEVEEEVLPQSVAEAKARFEQEEEIPQAKQPKHKKPTKPAQPAAPVFQPVAQPLEMRPATEVSSYKHVPAPVEGRKPVAPPQEQPKHVAPVAAPVVPPVPSPSVVPKVQSKKKVQISDKTRVKPPSPPGYDIQSEGFVQQISYASDTETGYLRLVSEDELDTPRASPARKVPPSVPPKPSKEASPFPEQAPRMASPSPVRVISHVSAPVWQPRSASPSPVRPQKGASPSPVRFVPKLTTPSPLRSPQRVSASPSPARSISPSPVRFVPRVASPASLAIWRPPSRASTSPSPARSLKGMSPSPVRFVSKVAPSPPPAPPLSVSLTSKSKVTTHKRVTIKPPSPVYESQEIEFNITGFESAPESHYEIREVGPVQEIHYVSDTEAATLRLVGYSTEEEPDSRVEQPYGQPEISLAQQVKHQQYRSVKPPSPRERKKTKKQKTPSPPKETFKPAPYAPAFAPQLAPKPEKQAPPSLPQNMKVKAPGVFKPSKPEILPKPSPKPTISKLDATVVPKPGSDFISTEAKFFQRKPVGVDIDIQESNIKPSEIARYQKFGDQPKESKDETDFRQQGIVVTKAGLIQEPFDVDQKKDSIAQYTKKTTTQISRRYQTDVEGRVLPEHQPDYISADFKPAEEQPVEVDLGIYGLEPSQLTKKTSTEVSKKFLTRVMEGKEATQQPDFISAQYQPGQPMLVDLAVDQSGLEPSDVTKKTFSQVSQKFQTGVSKDILPSQKPVFRSVEFKPMPKKPIDVDLGKPQQRTVTQISTKEGVEQPGLKPTEVSRRTFSQVSKKFQTGVAEELPSSQQPVYRSMEVKAMPQKPIDVDLGKPQQMTVTQMTTTDVSKKYAAGISEKVDAAQKPDYVSAEAKFFQRGPGSLDIEIEEEANLKPSEIAQLKKQQTLAKRYPPEVPPKPKVSRPEDAGKPAKKVEFYTAVTSPTKAQTFQDTFKFLAKPPGFTSVKPPVPVQKTSPLEKTVYFPDEKLSVTSVTLDTKPQPPTPVIKSKPPTPPAKPKKPTEPKKSEAKLQLTPYKPNDVKTEKPKPKLSPKTKRVEHKKKTEQKVTFSSDEGPRIKYRSESDSIFTESDSEAPNWAYVGPKIRKKKPGDKPKRLVIDIEPLRLQPELVDSREPVRAPEHPKPQIVDTDSEEVTHWAPDHNIIPQVASDIEKREEALRDLYRESAVREFIRREGQAPAEEDLYHKDKQRPPKFRTQIKNLTTLKENDSAHFECKLMPYGDPTMKVEWYKDNQPLHHGHRFKPMFEFGFVTLDILYTYPEDSGVYECRATNAHGTDVTQATIRCRGQQSIIAETQLPGEGALRLQEMEENWRRPAQLDEKGLEEPKVKYPPSIDMKPEPTEVAEGEPAKFMVKVSGYPRPRVTWWVNGTMIMTSSRFKIRYDGMMNYMDIPRVREYDSGQIRVVAKNSEGEAEASTVLNVLPKEDWRSQLRQAPKGELEIELDRKRKIELKNVEFKRPFEIPKAADYEIKQIERAHETRIKMKQEKEQFMKADSKFLAHPRHDQPARVVRPDRPEIQMEIQKARMVPVIPEQVIPAEDNKISETQIMLERREPPVFIKPLRPLRVTEGTPITIEVQFKGYPPPIISWYRDNFEIHPSHDFQINTTESISTLHIPEVFPEDTGMFMVKAYNMYGTVQCKAKLTVVEEEETTERVNSPEFRNLIHDINTVEGEPATFDCQLTGRPKPKVQWKKDGNLLEESPRWKFIEEEDNYTLLIYEVQPEDAGLYDCVALNNVGKATCTAKLNIEIPVRSPEPMEPPTEIPDEAPTVATEPQNLIVDEGEPATFTCKIKGSPAPIVSWYRNNQLIKPSKYFRMESSPDGTHSLSILEAFPEDSGNYRCVARNKAGETTCGSLLKVQGMESDAESPSIESRTQPPSFNQPVTNTLVVEGSTARFEARFSGVPPPEITWLRNGLQVIQNSKNYQIEKNPTSTVLTIKQAFPEDSGLITCRIKNISGTTECSAELYVQDSEEARLLEEKYITTIKTNPPEFIKALTPVKDMRPGEDVRLEAQILAYPPPRYNWYFSGKEIIPSDRRTIEQDKDTLVLIIRQAQPEDEGDYTLKVQNEMGEITCRTTLTIQGKEKVVSLPFTDTRQQTMTVTQTTTTITREEHTVSQMVKPMFTEPLEPEIYVRERGIARLECKLDAYPPPLVTWFINGMEVHPSPHYEVLYEDGKSVLLIIEVGPEDVGEYTCKAVSELGETVSSTTLYVQEPATEEMPQVPQRPEDTAYLQPSPSTSVQPPRFTEPLQSIEVVDGEELNVPCKVAGKPPPQISFFHNGKNIDQDEEYVISYNPDTGEITLLIVEVFPEDEGEYVCVAHNPVGEASTRMYLSVLDSGPAEEEIYEEAPMDVDQTEVKFSIQLPEEQMEITEDDLVPQTIERPKVVPLQKEAPRSPSPEVVYQATVPVPQAPEEAMEEVQEEVLEQEVKPNVIQRPKQKPLVEEKAPEESPEREVITLVPETRKPAPEEAKPEVSEESVIPQIVTKKIKLPGEKPIDERLGKQDSVPGEEPPKKKPDVVAQFETVLVPETTEEAPPEFVEALQPQILPDGEEVTMTCRVVGSPIPVVKWYKDGQELVPSPDFHICYDENTGVSTLTIPEVFPEDAGEYSCTAENMFGDATTSASLVVDTMPDEEVHKRTQVDTSVSETFTLTQDFTDSAVLETQEQYKTTLDIPPQFMKPLDTEITAKEGGSTTLEVVVAGEPQPKVTWYKNEVQILPDNRTLIVPEKNVTKLIIDHLRPEDEAEYICVAENDRGVVTCKTKLHIIPTRRVEFEIPEDKPERVRDTTIPKYAVSEDETAPSASEDELPEDKIIPPEFTELLQPVTIRDGERIELTVRFRGFPAPRIRWYHEGKEIMNSADFQITVDFNKGESTLVIVEVFPEDQGEYTCTAKNKYGETITTCRLNVISPEEEIPTKEFTRTHIEVQKMTQPKPVHEIHTSQMRITELTDEEIPEIPETTKYSEMIEVDHKPKVTESFGIIPIQQERQPQGPVQVEIQLGVPRTIPQTTTSVLTETTTYTQVMSELKEEPEVYPEIKEGDGVHKTTVTMKKEEAYGPMEFKLKLPEQEKAEVVTSTHQLVTEERKVTELRESPAERHTETIEIVQDQAPQDVEFQVVLPTTETTKTETTTVVERRQSVQKMEVEIKETFMKQKPKQTEFVIPLQEQSVDVTEVRDMPRPTEEQIEEVRPTIEKVDKEQEVPSEVSELIEEETPVAETEMHTTDTTDASFTMVIGDIQTPEVAQPGDSKTEEMSVDFTPQVIEETEMTFTLQSSAVVSEDVPESSAEKPEETPVSETQAPVDEIHITERDTIEIVKEPEESEGIEIEIDISDRLPEVTEVKSVEKVTETVTEETTLQLPESHETYKDEVTLDLQGKPLEEMQIDIQLEKSDRQVPIQQKITDIETVKTTEKEAVVLPETSETELKEIVIETEEKPQEDTSINIQLDERTVTETTDQKTMETVESVEGSFTFKIPQTEEVHIDKVTYETEERPSEAVEMTFQIPRDETLAEKETTVYTEQVTKEKQEIVEVPETEKVESEEIVIDVHPRPPESVQMTVQLDSEQTVPVTSDTTYTEQVTRTVTEEVLPEVSDTFTDEITVQVTPEKPTEPAEMTIQFDTTLSVPVQEDTTVTEQTMTITEEATEKPEISQTYTDEITVPITSEVTQEEQIIKTVTEESMLPEVSDTYTDEVTLQVTQDKPAEPVEMTFQFDTALSAPVQEDTTVTEQTMTITEEVTEKPEVSQIYSDELSFEIKGQPTESAEMTIKLESEKDTQIQTETVELPISIGTSREEFTIAVENQPDEGAEFTFQLQERQVPETMQTFMIDQQDEIDTGDQRAPDSAKQEVVTYQIGEQPSEELEMTFQISEDEQYATPDDSSTTTVETIKESFTFQVPEAEGMQMEEMTFQLPEQSEVEGSVRDVETTTTQETVSDSFTFQVPESEDQQTEETTFQLTEEPLNELKSLDETSTTTKVERIMESFTFQVPETEIETTELEVQPSQDSEMTIQIHAEDISPEDVEMKETTTSTTKTSTEEIFYDAPETQMEEITLEIEGKPQKEVKLTLKMPESDKQIIVTEEQTTLKESFTTREIFDVEIPEGHSAPMFTWGLTSLKVMDGEEAKFRCEVTAEPMPEISWFHDDKQLAETQDFKLTYDIESGSCTLLIVEVFPQDAGEYRCEAINPYGKAITRGFLEVEAYEYVPDTEEASDSVMSSLDTASPRPLTESDSEMTTLPKEILEEMRKMQEKMEIDIDEEEAGELTPTETETEFAQLAETELNLQKPGIKASEFKSQPLTETTLETTPTEISDVPEQIASQTYVSEDKAQPETSAPKESLAPQSELLGEKTSVSEIVSEAPEKTDEKTIEMEEVQPKKEILLVRTDELMAKEGKSEVSEIEAPESKESVVSEVEMDVEKITKETTESQTKPISKDLTETTDEVPSIVTKQTEETEIETPLEKSSRESVATKTDIVSERLEESEVSAVTDVKSDLVESSEVLDELQITESKTPLESKVEVEATETGPILTDVAEVQPAETKVTEETVLEIKKPEEEIPEIKEAPTSEIPEEASQEVKPAETSKEEITITVTPVEGKETPIFVTAAEHEAPRFLLPLTDVTVMENTTLRLEVTFTGSAEIIVKWYLDGEEIVPSEDIDIIMESYRSVMVIHQVFPEDEGEYWVECTNKEGKAKSTAYLTVLPVDEEKQKQKPKPKVSETTAKPDEVSQVSIEVQEQPEGVALEMDISEISETSAVEVLLKKEEIVSSDKSAIEITLGSTQKPEVETLPTEETPAVETAELDITEKDKGVAEAPRFTKTLHRQFEVNEGLSITLECEISGKETPIVTWYQDEEPITPDEHFVTEFEHGICRLTIHNVYLEDEAEYKCEAVTSQGVLSTVTELFVEKSNAGACVLLHEEVYKLEVNVEMHWKKVPIRTLSKQ